MSKSATITQTKIEMPLCRLGSTSYAPSIFSTTSTLPPSYATSISSTSQDLLASAPFAPTSILQIQSAGKGLISLPLPTKELCIPIFVCGENGKTERPKWLSIRPARRSGSCYLVDAEDESHTAIARMKYRFGPGRPPSIHIGHDTDSFTKSESDSETETPSSDDVDKKVDVKAEIQDEADRCGTTSSSLQEGDEFQLTSKNPFSRSKQFTSPRWGLFEWRYCSRKEKASFSPSPNPATKPNNLLVLERVTKSEDGKEVKRIRVAQLIRSNETRTPGSRSSSAGNGGRLELCLSDQENGVLIDEITVVVTVLVMLKKEIDRLRAAQIAVMSAGAGGGP